jgi:hypothetical protein
MSDDAAPTEYTLAELLDGIGRETGAPVDLKIIVVGDLHVVLIAAGGHEPAAGVAYRAKGPDGRVLSGTTDADGRLCHAGVAAGEYEITIDELTVRAPTVRPGDDGHTRWCSRHARTA